MKRVMLLLVVSAGLFGCVTGYQSDNFTGGYSDRLVKDNIWYVRYAGNGNTTGETVQTYWLYHAAEMTLQKGFDGFRIVAATRLQSGSSALEFPVDFGLVGKPALSMQIELLKKPFTPRPPVVFDATALQSALEPLVRGRLCSGNVCPHVHSYLMPGIGK